MQAVRGFLSMIKAHGASEMCKDIIIEAKFVYIY